MTTSTPPGLAPKRVNLDELLRLRAEGLAAGVGSGKWIKAAQAFMDAFPDLYATAQAMNQEAAALRADREQLLEFVSEVRRSGDSRLANMAIAVMHSLRPNDKFMGAREDNER